MDLYASDKVIILDRDGVINHDSDDYIKTVDEWIALEGSIEAMGKLYTAGYKLFVFTNQSGIGRGFYTVETMQDMHTKMAKLLAEVGARVEAIFFCPHKPEQHCDCRKPKPNMLLEMANSFQLDLTQAWVVGDSWRDAEAGMAVSANVAVVKTGKGKKTIKENAEIIESKSIPVFKNLAEFSEKLLAGKVV
jgi:D-glycero-D-manno-heptose 1,7-bisphosphate phosphatase